MRRSVKARAELEHLGDVNPDVPDQPAGLVDADQPADLIDDDQPADVVDAHGARTTSPHRRQLKL
jgi:hypothetical protein